VRPVVRLSGDDADVRAIGRDAVQVLKDDDGSARLFEELRALNDRRRRMLAASAHRGTGSAAPASSARPASRGFTALWGTLVCIGIVAALVLAVMFAAPDRKNAFADPALSASIGAIAAVIAIPALLIAVLLRVPGRESARVGETSAVLVGIIVLWSLGYRLTAGVSDDRGFVAADLSWWIPAAGVTALLLAGVVWRCDPVRRSGSSRAPSRRSGPPVLEDAVRDLRETAERLAARKTTVDARDRWLARLDTAERRGIAAAAVEQARTMSPSSWLAWLCYDGDIRISGVLPR